MKEMRMNFNTKQDLIDSGFEGFVSIKDLWIDKSMIPKEMGVYMILNTKNDVEFINPGVGGFFKGKDPNVDILTLKEKYVKSLVVYIGKAGGSSSKATLFSRLGQYLSFGLSKNVGHYGGRYIWQIKNHSNLVVCWKTLSSEEPIFIEKELLSFFKEEYSKLPFANLMG
jgi:hypothetical protein